MTHRERLLTALEGGTPDQVPVTWELVDRCALAFTGKVGWRAQCDAHRLIGSSIFNLQGVGPQVRSELPVGYEESGRDLGTEGRWRAHESTIRTPQGTLSGIVQTGGVVGDPLLPKRTSYHVKCRQDWEVVADYLDAWAQGARFEVTEAALARDYVGDDGLVGFWQADALYSLSNYREDSEFVLDLVDIPDQIDELVAKMHQRVAMGIAAFNASAADVLIYDVCWATTSLVSPAMCERWVVPEARWAVQAIAPGKKIVFFTSGRIRDVLPMLVAAAPDGIQHLDVLGDCDLAEVKASFGWATCLLGNYSPVVLAHGSVAQAEEEARRCLRAAKEGGGYIITTSDEVPADAELENMRAAVRVVEQEGRY